MDNRQIVTSYPSIAFEDCSKEFMNASSLTGPLISILLLDIHEMIADLSMKAAFFPSALRSTIFISFKVAMISSGRMKVASLISSTVIRFFVATLTAYLAIEAFQNCVYALRPSSESAMSY